MNIIQVFQQFPTQEDYIAHLEEARWHGEPTCPYCGSVNTVPNQHRHRCYDCLTSFSVTVGTIFHHTHMPLQKWFLAISLILNAKKGISSLQLSRDIEVNKNTAWRIAMQIRKAMTQADQRNLLTGVIEMDETYVGGKPRKGTKGDGPNGTHKRGRGTKKPPVLSVSFYVCQVNVFIACFPHGLSIETDAICIVNETVEDGICECRFSDHIMPCIDGHLTGD